MGKVTCFLPCRKGSQRVPRKNIKPFADVEYGLIEIKLRQLVAAEHIDEVVLSTNDQEILDFADSVESTKVRLHRRAEELSSSSTSTDALVAHAHELVPEGSILWTHVTSPFVTAAHYDEIISIYRAQGAAGYDSLMTTTEIHGFLWRNEKPMNYDRSVEKWPRTQTLEPVHEVNSAVFLAPSEVYRNLDDRIGERPYLYALDKLVSHDIDWPEDFVLGEAMLERGIVKL
ncbi:acylneuraminate cytidylyltransferase family protein [Nesterenkonia salmonea]|uniref:Acylneuraminate cytidylyltransferase family protein n=1 Tax=Nesterenkonia salmonea TaxID=1804987 RepID=A0A5R9B6Y7_9MICC|nr:acylneuraminate cytidylyltransferase family protein [Nesterenkonia salmonea]TLP92372.1 acylneuraminate cytidylyltransferase family protein [Nesterenkonia salmonea]